mmetsp:Transcript_3066/g.3268  ORF Transcript_3066/g.3268 Transcript_3066/m.3268 type:complete len:443 (-) Transcript_3066:118-1446(-)
MRQSSSSIPPTSSVSFFEKYEKMFHCGGCIADDEPVAAIFQQSRYGNEESNLTTEAISNWSSYIRERRQQKSAPLGTTVLLNQATSSSYDEIDKFDIEERTSKRQQSKTKAVRTKVKAHTEATAMKEYFTGIRNSHPPEIQMAIQRSPTTTTMMTQQQRRRQQQQHCHATTPIKSNTTSTRKSITCSSSSPKSTKRLHYDMLKDMLLANDYNYRSSKGNRYLNSIHNLTQTNSDLTQSTQSLSESEDDLSWDPIDEEQQPQEQEQQDTLVSILRRKGKLGTDTETKTNATDDTKNRVHLRFEQDTQFPDPNERSSSSTRKHVPRMSSRQKQEYRTMMHTSYPPTTDRRRRQQRQLEVSSLLMVAAAAGPSSLVIAPQNNHDEFRDSSLTATKKNSPNMVCSSHQERLARRAQQNQYHPPHHRRQSSATAEELLLSHYYTTNQ